MKNQIKKTWWQPAMEIFAQVSAWIVFPIIVALFLGKWLDERYNTEPRYLLICVGVGFVITNIGLIVNTVKSAKKMQAEDQNKKEIQNK